MWRHLLQNSRRSHIASGNLPWRCSSTTSHLSPRMNDVMDEVVHRRRPLSCRTFSKTTTTDKKDNNTPEKFAMPDRDVELKLAQIQATISDHYKQGNFSQALKVSQKLYQQTLEHFGQDHPATASALNNVGLMQKLLGDFVEARKQYTAALRTYAKVVGRDHASYAMTLHNLASLNKAQVHFDTSLKATERLNLVESALEYFEEAWWIRKAELGDDHPLTIATQSSMGATLAAQVLHQHRQIDGQGYVSLNPEAVTRKGWEAAEAHLRQALQTAIANPRGKSIHGNPKKNKTNNKKMKKAAVPKDDTAGQLETLSAASAAQNLAVFLKSRAVTEDPHNADMLQEAHELYKQVLKVRTELLPNPQHPDLLATKYSLAELLQVLGDEQTANQIRQEILDDYDGGDEASKKSDTFADNEEETLLDTLPARKVLVEKTSASKAS